MKPPPRQRPPAPRRPRGPLLAALVAVPALATTLLAAPGQAAPGTPVTAASSASSASTSAAADARTRGSDVTIVQANLRSPQPDAGFQADAREIQALEPDFITYNEVAFRSNAFLAPEGYAMWRTPGHYTGANPVAWRTDRWRVVAKGTRQMSSWDEKPPGRQTLLGMRFANWVTLRSTVDARTLSVVSMHAAPKVRGMPDLRRPAVRNLGTLVGELAPRGPVLVGGDFNVGARSADYPADLLGAAELESTFERLRTWFATGDHGGYTIDFVFVRDEDQIEADVHFPVELNSDHDAVVAGLSWSTEAPGTPGAPGPTTEVSNDPRGDVRERRAVARTVVTKIRSAPAGGVLQVSTRGLSLGAVQRALVAAADRGVKVRYTTRGPRMTEEEVALARSLRASAGSAFTRCADACATAWKTDQMPSVVLVADSAGRPTSMVSVNRRLRESLVTGNARAVSTTSPTALAATAAAFRRG